MSDEEITFDGNPVTLTGEQVYVGDDAPTFRANAGLAEEVDFDDLRGDDVTILTTALSVDTPVCADQFQQFDDRAGELDGVGVFYVTRDLPFALQRAAEEQGIEAIDFLSDYKYGEAGENFGVDVDEFDLLARSVFVIDGEGDVVYREIVSEIGEHPDYDAAIEAAADATG